MKRKVIIVGSIVVVVIVVIVYLLASPETYGNISMSSTEPMTRTYDFSFFGDAGDRIKFSFKSTIESGDLDILLYDSAGNEVYELDRAKELETFFNLSNSDTYTLVAECSDFVGKFDIKIHKWN